MSLLYTSQAHWGLGRPKKYLQGKSYKLLAQELGAENKKAKLLKSSIFLYIF